MNSDEGNELKRLPILRGMRARYQVWRTKKSRRRPPGTLGRGAKDADRGQGSGDEIEGKG